MRIDAAFAGALAAQAVRAGADEAEVFGTGLCVTGAMGMHIVKRISGDFSIDGSGIWIENSAFGFPVKEAVIAGSVLDLFGRVAAAGDDFRWFGNVGGPSLVISDVDISG
ncbi:MAG: hypothetical protein OHK006_08650 [Thermodesulfovibrionales bacterium]